MPKEQRSAAGRNGRRWPALQAQANSVFEKGVRAGARVYDRERDLPGLIRLDPGARGNETVAELQAIVTRLARALRAERNRARSGHWTYDLNRHIALRQAHLAESTRLAARLKPNGR